MAASSYRRRDDGAEPIVKANLIANASVFPSLVGDACNVVISRVQHSQSFYTRLLPLHASSTIRSARVNCPKNRALLSAGASCRVLIPLGHCATCSVAAVIATYNRPELLVGRSLTSVARQTRLPDHLIVVDDSDGTIKRANAGGVKAFKVGGVEIHYIENRRSAGAICWRRAGRRHCNGFSTSGSSSMRRTSAWFRSPKVSSACTASVGGRCTSVYRRRRHMPSDPHTGCGVQVGAHGTFCGTCGPDRSVLRIRAGSSPIRCSIRI